MIQEFHQSVDISPVTVDTGDVQLLQPPGIAEIIGSIDPHSHIGQRANVIGYDVEGVGRIADKLVGRLAWFYKLHLFFAIRQIENIVRWKVGLET